MPELVQSSTKIVAVGPTLSQAFRVLSLICALLVVMIHVPVDLALPSGWWTSRIFHAGVCGMAVPFFFFAAGFFLAGHCAEAGWWRREVTKRCKSLLIPYIVFGVLYAVIMYGMVRWSSCLYDSTWTKAENLAFVSNPLNILGLVPTGRPVLKLLWFVRGLFVFVVLSPLVWFAVRGRSGLGFVLLALSCFFGVKLMTLPGLQLGSEKMFGMGVLPLGGLFHFSAGMFMRSHGKVFASLMSALPTTLIFGAGLILGTSILSPLDWIDGPLRSVGNLSVYIGCLSLFAKYPVSISPMLLSCAFPVYLLHRFLLLPIRLVFKLLTGSTMVPWCWHFIMSLVLFAFSVGFVLLMRRLIPKTSKVIFGGR